jgi:hypothetical protein
MTLNRITQFIALLLIPALLSNSMAYAAGKPLDSATVKEKIAERGVGRAVGVVLADNAEINGIIVSIGNQSFALKSEGVDQPQSIQYTEITRIQFTGIHRHRHGLSRGARIGILAGLGGTALIVGFVLFVNVLVSGIHD